jgi:hypothetical protein
MMSRSGSINKLQREGNLDSDLVPASIPPIPQHNKHSEEQQESPTRSGLMHAIKSKQFKLRKTESNKRSSGADGFGNEVAAILSRRAALEMSSDEDDDEEWI